MHLVWYYAKFWFQLIIALSVTNILQSIARQSVGSQAIVERWSESMIFSSAVLLDLYRLTNHTTLLLQQEDGLCNREYAAACALPPQQHYRACELTRDKAF